METKMIYFLQQARDSYTQFHDFCTRFENIFVFTKKQCSSCHKHGTKKKSESLAGIAPMTFHTLVNTLTTQIRETGDELGHILGLCMTCVLRDAGISHDGSVMCGDKKRKIEIYYLYFSFSFFFPGRGFIGFIIEIAERTQKCKNFSICLFTYERKCCKKVFF